MADQAGRTADLDNPAWHALTGPHVRFAEIRGCAARYHSEVSPFAALSESENPDSWDDLAAILGPGEAVALVGARPAQPPEGWSRDWHGEGVQMVDESVDTTGALTDAVPLGVDDAEEMLALVERTKPGPFRVRTVELGDYLGVRREGRLVAMAGVRMRPAGWSEISAVCTDADHRGQGLAGGLVRAVVGRIRDRGETALLHAAATNVGAIRLYREMGFVTRRTMYFAQVSAPQA